MGDFLGHSILLWFYMASVRMDCKAVQAASEGRWFRRIFQYSTYHESNSNKHNFSTRVTRGLYSDQALFRVVLTSKQNATQKT